MQKDATYNNILLQSTKSNSQELMKDEITRETHENGPVYQLEIMAKLYSMQSISRERNLQV